MIIFVIGSFQKDPQSTPPPPPHRGNFCHPEGEGKNLFLIIVSVLGHLKWVGESTPNLRHGGGMDGFWNDPFYHNCAVIIIFM
jgi:hypothetical protein